TAHDDDGTYRFVVEQQFFAASAGKPDVDGGEDTAFSKFAVQQQFHVAGTLKFFVDYIVHAAAGIDQGCGDDGQAAALFNFTGSSEEAFGWEESARIETAGECAAAGLHGQVIGAAQAGDAIEQHYYVTASLNQAFGSFQHHLCYTFMGLGLLVEGRTDDLGPDGAFHIGDFFWSLSDYRDDQVGI